MKLIISTLVTFLPPILLITNQVKAQKEIILGSHTESGHSNTSVIKGGGIGMKIKAGRKKITLQSLNVNLNDRHPDSISFYARIFPLDGETLDENIMPDVLFTASLKDDKIYADLSRFQINVTNDFVSCLEWAADANGTVNQISFRTGLFKKGIYYKEIDDPG